MCNYLVLGGLDANFPIRCIIGNGLFILTRLCLHDAVLYFQKLFSFTRFQLLVFGLNNCAIAIVPEYRAHCLKQKSFFQTFYSFSIRVYGLLLKPVILLQLKFMQGDIWIILDLLCAVIQFDLNHLLKML